MRKRLKAAVLLSGGGTTLSNLLECAERGEVPMDVKLVISSRDKVRGLRIAADAGIRTEVIRPKDYVMDAREAEVIYDWGAMSRQIDRLLLPGGFDVVCMAGYLSRYMIPDELYGRVFNIHPSLIPMFCGEGMYGLRVHKAVVESGVKVTGCTVHLVNNEYDSGPIVVQRACPVFSGDTPEAVAARVFEEECVAYPAALNLFAAGRIRLLSRDRVFVDEPRYRGN